MKKLIYLSIICMILSACAPNVSANSPATDTPSATTTATALPAELATPTVVEKSTSTPLPARQATPTSAPISQVTQKGKVPNFDHIVLIVLENRDYEEVIGSSHMPNLNALAKQYVLLTNDYAVRHPSLPNYISLVSGDTQKITQDCNDCFVNAPNLADLIEASGRTWKAYEEGMPSACFLGDASPYAQKHDPFIYFDSIRLNSTRCKNSIVPMTQLDGDLAANTLPNFSFVMPNLCNSGHDCSQDIADTWIHQMVNKLQASTALGKNSLIIITYDEGNDKNTTSCCGMGKKAGGRVATVLISPLAKPGFTDGTAVSHYGLLKTILQAWNLPNLGHTADAETQPIVAPWQ